MAAPAFVDAGSGVAITGTSGTASKTSCTAGNLIFLHAVIDGMTEFHGLSGYTNIESLAGTDNAMSDDGDGGFYQIGIAPATGRQSIHVGRAMSNGTCSVDIEVVSEDVFARIYEFTDASTNALFDEVFENTEGSPVNQSAGNSTTVVCADVTTTGVDRLAVAFVGITDDVAVANFTGESGGDWTETVAEFSSSAGTQACLQLQAAALSAAGTIAGGTATIGVSSGFSVATFAIVPSTSSPPGSSPALRVVRSSLRW